MSVGVFGKSFLTGEPQRLMQGFLDRKKQTEGEHETCRQGSAGSLYFDYPRFAAPRVAELDGATARHPVLIVGAGPIGMTAALVLARYGVGSVLIDRKDTFNRRQPRDLHRAAEHAYPGADRHGRAVCRKGARLAVRPQLLSRRTDFPAGDAATAGREISTDVQSAAAVHRKVPARCGRGLCTSSTCAGRASCRASSITTAAYRCGFHRRRAIIGSTPTICWPLMAARSPVRSMLGLRLKGDNYERPVCDRGYPHGSRFFRPSAAPSSNRAAIPAARC